MSIGLVACQNTPRISIYYGWIHLQCLQGQSSSSLRKTIWIHQKDRQKSDASRSLSGLDYIITYELTTYETINLEPCMTRVLRNPRSSIGDPKYVGNDDRKRGGRGFSQQWPLAPLRHAVLPSSTVTKTRRD